MDVQMTDSCDQHPETMNESSSDDDSVSLLQDHNYFQSRGEVAEEVAMEISGLDPQVGNIRQQEEVEISGLNPPEPEICSRTQDAAGCDKSTTQSANVLPSVKLSKNIRLNKRNEKGETLLHRACMKEDLPMVGALIQAGIIINTEDYAGWTALHEAAAVGNAAVVELLLKAGANANAGSFDGVRPLHDAVSSGHYEVVKLLLQFGSNTCYRTVGGLSALDMAQDENMKELLLTFRPSSVINEKPEQHTPGCKSSEAQCHKQLCSQSSSANERSRESGDRNGAREPADIQLRERRTNTHTLSHSEALELVLEEVGGKQTEISNWSLTAPLVTGRFRSTLTQIQNQLIEVLDKQSLEKDQLAQKQWSVSHSLWQRVMKSRLVSLASRQRTLVGLLQKQMHLAEMYVTMKAKLSAQSPKPRHSNKERQQADQISSPLFTSPSSKARASQSCRALTQEARVLTSAAQQKSSPPALTLTNAKKNPKHSGGLNKKTSVRQSTTRHTEITLKQIDFRAQVRNALIQTKAEDRRGRLSELIKRKVLKPGSPLNLFTKGQQLCAFVLADGSLKDLKGKVHLSPERWLESVFGNHIPVGSAYAWDKVTFEGKPLSSYTLNLDTETNTLPEVGVQLCRDSSAAEDLTPEEASLKRLMRVRTIHLVEDEEWLPNAVMDIYWDKLLKDECLEPQWT
ncbi:ankyrin repeat domain-containing protein 31-like [Labrus bergylta]|uniref:ankyrin repeat domain-containing protein 31-like n=1 Tax=Labrus bergylta TaxID=56723 RepID=UPI0033132AA9